MYGIRIMHIVHMNIRVFIYYTRVIHFYFTINQTSMYTYAIRIYVIVFIDIYIYIYRMIVYFILHSCSHYAPFIKSPAVTINYIVCDKSVPKLGIVRLCIYSRIYRREYKNLEIGDLEIKCID